MNRRVVLIEDHAMLRRFVALALEDLDLDLVPCATAAEGLAALRAAPAALVLTDLMLPDASGLVIVELLTEDAALLGGARVAVLSAGLHTDMRLRLQALGVWRALAKPVPVAELRDCVLQALQAPAAGPASEPAPEADDEGPMPEFVVACVEQFGRDIEAGDLAVERGDRPDLLRLAHDLKSVLALLGRAQGSALAASIEAGLLAGDWAAALGAWPRLRAVLVRAIADA